MKDKIGKMISILPIIPVIIFIIGMLSGLIINDYDSFLVQKGDIELSIRSLFFHNMKSIFCNVSGILTFGLTTCLNIFISAFMLGLNIKIAICSNCSLTFILLHTMPHFTEYIAIFISGYLGLCGYEMIGKVKIGKSYILKKINLFLITIPLILFAAVMEVKVAC